LQPPSSWKGVNRCLQVRILKLSELLLDYSKDKDEVVASVLAATQSDLSFI